MIKSDLTMNVMPYPILWLIHPWLHNAVLDLLHLMLPFHDEVFQSGLLKLLEEARDESSKAVLNLASNIVMLLLRYQPDFFRGKDLSHLELPGLRCIGMRFFHQQIDFTGTSFQGSNLTDTDFSNAILTNADLRDTTLNNVSFRMGELFIPLPHPKEPLLIVESRQYLLLINTETGALVKKIQAGHIGRTKLSPDQKYADPNFLC